MSQSQNKVSPIPIGLFLAIQAVFLLVVFFASVDSLVRSFFMIVAPALCLSGFLLWSALRGGAGLKNTAQMVGVAASLLVLSLLFQHDSIFPAFVVLGLPTLSVVFALAFYASRERPERRLVITAAGSGLFIVAMIFVRVDGFEATMMPEFNYRWATTTANPETEAMAAAGSWQPDVAEWPYYRGPERDGSVTGFVAQKDWQSKAPKEIWRSSIGNGWGSMIYISGRLFTQEQRGDMEWVSCYDANNGALIWRMENQEDFTETISGAGPRSTPAYADGRIFALGTTGLLSALDAATGDIYWQNDLAESEKAVIPTWGVSCSPLVVDDTVVVYVDAADGKGLMAFDRNSGSQLWKAETSGQNYSSPQLMTLSGTRQILFGDGKGFHGFDPLEGKKLWSYNPQDQSGTAIVQAQMVGPDDLIVPLGEMKGMARLKVTRIGDAWNIKEVWSSNMLKPWYSGVVFYEGNLYGFDKNIMVCLNAQTGERHWKKGRYGYGQAVLLEDSGQILAVNEKGELIVMAANPEDLVEHLRMPVVEGKTWNHPIVAAGRMFVRNGSEMVCLSW